MRICVHVCVCHVPALLAFHTAELHMPTSRQKAHMADMQLSVKEKKTKHNLKSVVKDKEFSLANKTRKKGIEFHFQPSVCALQLSSEEEYTP